MIERHILNLIVSGSVTIYIEEPEISPLQNDLWVSYIFSVVCLSVSLSVFLCVCESVHLCVCVSVCLSPSLPSHLSASIFRCFFALFHFFNFLFFVSSTLCFMTKSTFFISYIFGIKTICCIPFSN